MFNSVNNRKTKLWSWYCAHSDLRSCLQCNLIFSQIFWLAMRVSPPKSSSDYSHHVSAHHVRSRFGKLIKMMQKLLLCPIWLAWVISRAERLDLHLTNAFLQKHVKKKLRKSWVLQGGYTMLHDDRFLLLLFFLDVHTIWMDVTVLI